MVDHLEGLLWLVAELLELVLERLLKPVLDAGADLHVYEDQTEGQPGDHARNAKLITDLCLRVKAIKRKEQAIYK